MLIWISRCTRFVVDECDRQIESSRAARGDLKTEWRGSSTLPPVLLSFSEFIFRTHVTTDKEAVTL